ncbi:hypothetical protein GCM10022226_26710 [Sphaerisporangium flaviroseum]|uniref:Uncharacterized protein n=1 Tax=Sphaerisporangium flaviroseum TaxID=509199 RepID=A0ABP7HVI3_9ACTN
MADATRPVPSAGPWVDRGLSDSSRYEKAVDSGPRSIKTTMRGSACLAQGDPLIIAEHPPSPTMRRTAWDKTSAMSIIGPRPNHDPGSRRSSFRREPVRGSPCPRGTRARPDSSDRHDGI